MAMWNICSNCGCDWIVCGQTGFCTTDKSENYVAGAGVNVNVNYEPCGCTNWKPISRKQRNKLRQFDRDNPARTWDEIQGGR